MSNQNTGGTIIELKIAIRGHFNTIGNKLAEVNDIENIKRYRKLYIIEIINVTEICVARCLPYILSLIIDIIYPTITNKTVFKPNRPSEKQSLAMPIVQFVCNDRSSLEFNVWNTRKMIKRSGCMPRTLMCFNNVVWINDMHKITLIMAIHGMRISLYV